MHRMLLRSGLRPFGTRQRRFAASTGLKEPERRQDADDFRKNFDPQGPIVWGLIFISMSVGLYYLRWRERTAPVRASRAAVAQRLESSDASEEDKQPGGKIGFVGDGWQMQEKVQRERREQVLKEGLIPGFFSLSPGYRRIPGPTPTDTP
eukprot:Hpha_TRINITY_DN23335_c0_g1::TRINITY_DN23335_c0_g1_i1::g.96974::m.96974